MGWSWSVALVQAAHEFMLCSGPFGPRQWLVDKKLQQPQPSPNVHMMYVDNFAALGPDPVAVEQDTASMEAQLRARGLATHDRRPVAQKGDIIGFSFDGLAGVVKPAVAKYWKIVLATKHVLAHPMITGRELEKLIGHWMHICLVRRESLAIFSAVFQFITRSYDRRQPLWHSTRRELHLAVSIASLLRADLRAP